MLSEIKKKKPAVRFLVELAVITLFCSFFVFFDAASAADEPKARSSEKDATSENNKTGENNKASENDKASENGEADENGEASENGEADDENVASRESLDFPILFAKQHNYQGLHIYDSFYQWRPGGGLYVLENPSDPPEKYRIRPIIDPETPETLGEGIYFDPSLSYDAKKLLFCFKGSPQDNSTIYEIGIDGRGLRRLTNLDSEGNPYFGSGFGRHDVRPAYLPDGRIVFTSTRYSGLVPCANNGVAILHVMNGDGSDVHPISVNNVTEFDPSVLDDGRILFGRWEYIDKNALTIQSLWSVYPDGTNETAVFANNMVFPEAILQAKPVPGRPDLVVGTFAPHNAPPRGAIAIVDITGDKNGEEAIYNFEYPDCPTFDRGQSCDPWALDEDVVLYSGMIQPKLQTEVPTNPAASKRIGGVLPQPAGNYNALLLIDRLGNRVEILRDSSIDLHSPIPVRERPVPHHFPESVDRTKTTGSFFVKNVYEGLDGVRPGSAKWLRVVEETSRVSASPGSNGLNQTFSISAALAWSAKIYHGIVPVKEDGSVYFDAPSGRALYFQLLDEDYRLIRGMRTFIQAAPGTTRSCTGCHEYGPPELTEAGAVRYPKEAAEKLRDESCGSGYLDYVTKIQPIWNAKCVSCHGGADGLAAGLDLSDGVTERFNISYDNLTSRRRNQYQIDLIAGVCCMNGTAYYSCKFFAPYEHGSGKAPLAELLLNDPTHAGLLTQEERELVFTWIDSNGLYFGTWDYTGSGPLLKPWAEAKQSLIQIMKESRCAECHTDGKGNVRRFENDWINLNRPEASRILRAPLKKDANAKGLGLQLCRSRSFDQNFLRLGVMSNGQYEHAVKDLEMFPTQEWRSWSEEGTPDCSFESTDDPVYQKMLAVVQKAREKALTVPRIDMPNADECPGGIIEGRFRQILPQPLPETPIALKGTASPDGVVELEWECSSRTIGLVFEIHRSETPGFVPSEKTLLGKTERFSFKDETVVPGKQYYAVVPVSDPTETCGSCRSTSVSDSEFCDSEPGDVGNGDSNGDSSESRKSIPKCAASISFRPRRANPVYIELNVPEFAAPEPPRNLVLKSGEEYVLLSWDAPEKPRDSENSSDVAPRYYVYRQKNQSTDDWEREQTRESAADVSNKIRLTETPSYSTYFLDDSGIPGEEYLYSVTSVSRRDVESEPGVSVAGRSRPTVQTDLFVAPLTSDSIATVSVSADASNVVSNSNLLNIINATQIPDSSNESMKIFPTKPESVGKPTFFEESLLLEQSSLIYPGQMEFNSWKKFALSLDVYFESPGEIPIVISFGSWNQSGWFLQNLNGKWRFHFGGLDCDSSSEVPLHEWLHIVATYDGEKLTLTENGKPIAERSGVPNRSPWTGNLYIGQYSKTPGSSFQFNGRIRNIRFSNYIP